MNKLLFLLLLVFSITSIAQNIPPRPNPPRLVNDLARILTSDQIESLERKLVDYDDSTSTQIVVVTVPTLGDYEIEEYGLKLLREWGVGSKKNNNGIVILASFDQVRKVRIEVGYGMEGVVPDLIADRIIENEIIPNFRQGNYYRGFDEAIDAIRRAASGEYQAPQNYRKSTRSRGGSIFSLLIPLIIILIIISRSGGGGGGMMSRRGSNPFLGGFLGGMIGSSLGRGDGGWSGGGGGWSGGGDGGGWSGGGGGDFGGFGGGSGGGGGASGSW